MAVVEGTVSSGLRALSVVMALTFGPGCDHRDRPVHSPQMAGEPLACRARLDPQELLPSDALAVAHYDMARERRFAPKVSTTEAVGPRGLVFSPGTEALRLAWVGLAAACELDEDYWGEAWAAVDRDEELVVVLTGKGIGGEDELRCIQRRLARYDEDVAEPGVLTGDGCGLSLSYDGLEGFAPNDDLLVLGTSEGVERARRAWNRGSSRAPEHLLPRRRAAKTYAWVAVDVPGLVDPDELDWAMSEASSELDPLPDIRTVEVEARLGRRYELRLGGHFGNEADARAAAGVIQALLDAPPPALPDWAINLIERFELLHDDMDVGVGLSLRRKQAHELGLLPAHTEASQAPGLPWLLLSFLL